MSDLPATPHETIMLLLPKIFTKLHINLLKSEHYHYLMKKLKKYLKTWLQLSNCAISTYLASRLDYGSYFVGKLIRFGFMWLMIMAIFNYTNDLAGYSKYEILLFFLTFNLMDSLGQAFLRGVYHLSDKVKQGDFDYVLVRPVSPLFYSLTSLTDILDFIFLLPTAGLLYYVISHIALTQSVHLGSYILFILIGLVVVVALHIIAAGVTVITSESEAIVWFYRESLNAVRLPSDIYPQTLQAIFTYIVPIIVIVVFPAKALLGLLSSTAMITALLIALVFLTASIIIWNRALKSYSSASS